MTILTIGKSFKTKPELDVSTIVEPSKARDISLTDKEARSIAKRLKFRVSSCDWTDFHMSTKSGPNGPALANSIKDVAALPPETILHIKKMGGDALTVQINKLSMQTPLGLSMLDIWLKLYPSLPKWPRKLSYFSDKEGKTRVIAILDYWSQTALRPLHIHCMDTLRKIKSDCTFDQNAFRRSLPTCGPYYCYDLSAATDRMPITLQKRVLEYLLPADKIDS
jgi:hypothetical protein